MGDLPEVVERRFCDRIEKSVTSASASGRTVRDPVAAATYATNALLHHDEGKQLLAEAALVFAAEALARLQAGDA